MELPSPQVTVVDPRRPGALEPAREPAPLRLGRRGVAALALAAVAGAAVLVVADGARDRRDAEERRRRAGVVDLALADTAAHWAAFHDPARGTGTVESAVRLVNHGPADVQLTAATLGDASFAGRTTLAAGRAGTPVPLRSTVRCSPGGGPPPVGPEDRVLRLRVETPAGPREVALQGDGLPRGSFADGVARACASPPLRDTVRVAATVVAAQSRTADLRVLVVNEGRRPVRLLSLVPARGLVVESVDGRPADLPVDVPAPTAGQQAVLRLLVRVSPVCGALLGPDPFTPIEQVAAVLEAVDRLELTSVETVAGDPDGLLRQLAGRTCASG